MQLAGFRGFLLPLGVLLALLAAAALVWAILGRWPPAERPAEEAPTPATVGGKEPGDAPAPRVSEATEPLEPAPAARAMAHLRIRVQSVAGEAIASYRATVDDGAELRPPATGTLELELDAGGHDIAVRWGRFSEHAHVEAAPGETTELDLRLDAPYRISGWVHEDGGTQRVAGATVDVNGQVGVTAEDGTFTIPYPHLLDTHRLVHASVDHPAYWPTARHLVQIGGGATTEGVALPLRRGSGTVVALVTDGAGQALPEVMVQLTEQSTQTDGRHLPTDGTGRARFEHVPAGAFQATAIASTPGGHHVARTEGFELAPGEEREVTLPIGIAFRCTARVPGGLGLRVLGAGDGALAGGSPLQTLEPRSSEGDIAVELPAGDYQLVLLAGDSPVASLWVTVSGVERWDLTFEDAAPLGGHFYGEHLPGGIGLQPLGFEEDELNPMARLIPLESDGSFRFEHLPPGRYRVVCPEGWGLTSSPIVTVTATGEATELELIPVPK